MTRVHFRRIILSLTFMAILATVTGVAVLSPLVLARLGNLGDYNWQTLSNIGQSYGTASALLSGFALVGVAFTAYSQIGESRSRRDETNRLLHSDLIKLALNDPTLRPSWGMQNFDPDTMRRILYTNLVVDYWFHQYRVRIMLEAELRPIVTDFFSQEIGRQYWSSARESWYVTFRNAHERRFGAVLDTEYEMAVATRRPSPAILFGKSLLNQAAVGNHLLRFFRFRQRHCSEQR